MVSSSAIVIEPKRAYYYILSSEKYIESTSFSAYSNRLTHIRGTYLTDLRFFLLQLGWLVTAFYIHLSCELNSDFSQSGNQKPSFKPTTITLTKIILV